MSKFQILDFEQYLEHIKEEEIDVDDIKFNDEIVSIEYVGDEEMGDIEVTGDHLFFLDDILVHNSAINNTSSDNSTISDSMGTAMTADWMCFLLQTEELKEKNIITFKITKNRYNGRTDIFNMNVDYTKMRVSDEFKVDSFQAQQNLINEVDKFLNVINENDIKNMQNRNIKDQW